MDQIFGKVEAEPQIFNSGENFFEGLPSGYRFTTEEIYLRRQTMLAALQNDAEARALAHKYYSVRPAAFITDWVDTYDPRLAPTGVHVYTPFNLYKRQTEMTDFILGCVKEGVNGLIEKSRDVGATWTCAAFSVWLWLYWDGVSIGWGSRKEMLVDRLNDPSSIFEKIRLIISHLPDELLPALKRERHLNHLRIINPDNGSSIIGEAGDQIGRGGRTLCYFKDESAHYERPELIEAALAENTNCQIDISSVSGIGTVFHRKREGGHVYEGGDYARDRTNVFIFDWRDHPLKTQAWYDERRARYERDGLLHIHAQEIDRDYAASLPAPMLKRDWVRAAIDFDVPGLDDGGYIAGLDLADGGGDLNALAIRKGERLVFLDSWAHGDTGETTRRVVEILEDFKPVDVQYDSIGIGAGVKSETNRLERDGLMPDGVYFSPWNAGGGVNFPDDRVVEDDINSLLNRDYYQNLRAQAWWGLRHRLEKTWRYANGEKVFDPEELISFSTDIPSTPLYQLEKELCQVQKKPTATLKQGIEKTPQGTKSPNLADAVVMAYYPAEGEDSYTKYLMRNVV